MATYLKRRRTTIEEWVIVLDPASGHTPPVTPDLSSIKDHLDRPTLSEWENASLPGSDDGDMSGGENLTI